MVRWAKAIGVALLITGGLSAFVWAMVTRTDVELAFTLFAVVVMTILLAWILHEFMD